MESVSNTVSYHKNSNQKKVIKESNAHDVLFGRGGRINQHEGNIRFRNLIHQKQNAYNLKSNTKEAKATISRNIVENIKRSKGRFLKHEKVSTSSQPQWSTWWVEVDDAAAMLKTSQALREGAPILRAQANASGGQKRKRRKNGTESSKRARKSHKAVCTDVTNSKIQNYVEDRNPAMDDSINDSLLRMDLPNLPNYHFELPGNNCTDKDEVVFTPEMFSSLVRGQDSIVPCAVSPRTSINNCYEKDEEAHWKKSIQRQSEPSTPTLESENPSEKKRFTDEDHQDFNSFVLDEGNCKNDISVFPVTKYVEPFTDEEYQEFDIPLLVDVLLMR